jgi:hypothetical protein
MKMTKQNVNNRPYLATWLASVILISFYQLTFSQVSDLQYESEATRRGTAAAAMLEIGIGARAEALGGAFVAIADDPSALYWNPAGIVNINSLSLQATKTDWLVGTKFNAVDLVVPLGFLNSALGFHLAMLDYGENPVRTVERPEGTGEIYSANDLVAGLYYALSITDRISFGLGMKYFNQKIWHVEGSAIAVDLSILFNTPLEGLRIGGTISNLGPDFGLSGRDLTRTTDIDGSRDVYFNNDNVAIQLATEPFPLPLLFRFGAAYEMLFGPKYAVQLAANVNHPNNDVETLDVGVEGRLFNMLYLRAGYRSLFADYAADGLTLGAGLHYTFENIATLTFDYAWTDWSILTSVNRFTLGISTAL